MNQGLWLLGVFVAALLGGLIAAAPIFFLPLVGSLLIAMPLTIIVAGTFAGLAATWAGDWLAPESARRNLLRIVGLSEAAAAVLAVVLLLLLFWLESLGTLSGNPFFGMMLFGAIVLAISATVATWRCMAPDSKVGTDALATLGLVGAMGFVVLWAVGLGSILGQFGL